MKVSLNWLKTFVDIDRNADELAELITKSGVEIGEVTYLDNEISKLVVAEVKTCVDHPDSDHLHLCEVTTDGTNTLQVVCGASNVAAGQKVVYAQVGATLPNGIKIKEAKLRGIDSYGMLCGMSELGVEEALLHEADKIGIKVLPEDAPLGADAIHYLGLDDVILDLDLTPNRTDCLSIYGVALEVAALLDKPIKPLEVTLGKTSESADYVEIEALDEEASSFYSASLIEGVKVSRSPLWLETRLQSAGVRPISNVVDITNYVMLETGQPLHAFDYQKLPQKKLSVRLATSGEKLTTLDGEERNLTDGMIVIADGGTPIALGGVMGGLSTEVEDNTTNILLEAALFHGTKIRRTAQALALRSESSLRNEKGLPMNNTTLAAFRAMGLLEKYAGGKVEQPLVYKGKEEKEKRTVVLRVARVAEVLGFSLEKEDIIHLLERLHFICHEKDEASLIVEVPYRRLDVAIEEDLLEEIARLYGYDNIPTKLPKLEVSLGGLNKKQKFNYKIKHVLAELGLYEIITFGFYHEKHHDYLRFDKEDRRRQTIAIKNPLSEDLAVMRTTLLGNLLGAVQANRYKQAEDIGLFELGRVFLKGETFDETTLAEEKMTLALALSGKTKNHWLSKDKAYDYYDLKGIVESLFSHLSLEEVRYEALRDDPTYHPGQSARIFVGERLIGKLGAVHPEVANAYDLKQGVFVAELDIEAMLLSQSPLIQFKEVSKYPVTTRDMAILVEEKVSFSSVEKAIHQAKIPFLISVDFFDIYRDEKLGEGKKSFAFALRFQSSEETLTDEVVDKAFHAILSSIEEKTGGKLRLQ